ncbi:MAG: bifunctional oligoribonuclease/PAP phosphatase NrnA [Olsenella sp.]|nr:bifunctional oligoribonuclease/PAP phosphatase NrnA [Olsenella sp.]
MGLTVNPEQTERLSRIAELVEESDTIAICAHTGPDGDALGSALALELVLRAKWPEKSFVGLLADDDPVPRIYSYLPGADRLVPASTYEGIPDLFVSVDVSVPHRLNNGEAVMRRARRHAIIDHHPCDEPEADAWLIRPDAAAVGVLVCEFALDLGVEITPDIARCLYCAIATDTGRFQYQNADPEAFQVASLLVDAGASPSELSLNVYQNFSLSYLHLESLVMGRITTFADGRISYSYATSSDLDRTGASLDECDGLVDAVRSVAGAEVTLFLKEIPGGKVRGNLRSKTDKDVSCVARALGGGGHRAAAGFTVDGDIDQALSAALPPLVALFSDDEGASGERA